MADVAQITPRYTRIEDLQGLTISAVSSAFGMVLLSAAGLITGGTAGLSLLLSYGTGLGFGLIFFFVNLPFYWFAWVRRGATFTVKTFLSVAAVSFLAELIPQWVNFSYLHPLAATILFGVIGGFGVLGLFRHGASLGGMGIVAVIVQDKFGIRAGWVQMGWDLTLFAIAAFVLPLPLVAWSAIGAIILNLILAVNHRRDWYLPG